MAKKATRKQAVTTQEASVLSTVLGVFSGVADSIGNGAKGAATAVAEGVSYVGQGASEAGSLALIGGRKGIHYSALGVIAGVSIVTGLALSPLAFVVRITRD